MLTHKVKYDGAFLTSADVGVVSLTIYNSLDAVIVATTPMTWDADKARWFYTWASPATAGSYQVKVGVAGLSGETNWEWKRVRLASNPA